LKKLVITKLKLAHTLCTRLVSLSNNRKNEGDERHVNPFLMFFACISARLSALPLASAEPSTVRSRYFDHKTNNIVTLLLV
jgi:hypothetical protein